MKYCVNILKHKTSNSNFNAFSKAPADVIKTLQSVGVKNVNISIPNIKLKLVQFVVGYVKILFFTYKLKKDDIVYIQSYGYYINVLVKFSVEKGAKLVYITHDLSFLRLGNLNGDLEKDMLKKMDFIFVHTESMRDFLIDSGVNSPMRIMHLFDYYSDDPMLPLESQLVKKNTVAFAGNLKKSKFIQKLIDSDIPDNIEYHLYGLKTNQNLDRNRAVVYKGAFSPDNTAMLDAGWGLLWDGDSIDNCTGLLGDYLKINSSHKLSLYLACGMPVILWEKSSLAKWLSDKGVCILIHSLNDIPLMIDSIDQSTYKVMVENARHLGLQLRTGQFLKSIL